VGSMATIRRQPDTLGSQMAHQDSTKERSDQRATPDGDGREAAVVVLAAHLAELDEAEQDGDDELWNEISSVGIDVEIGGSTWQLWFDQDGWTAARPTYEPEHPGVSKGFGDGDLMGRVGPATLSPEEVVRRLVTLEFESF
jgi:hypothetical protein